MSRLSSMSRFAEPDGSEEYHLCQGCGQRFYYTKLDNDGLCEDCRPDPDNDESED